MRERATITADTGSGNGSDTQDRGVAVPPRSFAARARLRPVLYPAGFLLAFILNLVIGAGVSPYAAARPLIVGLLVGLGIPWLIGLWSGDRHVAGLMGGLVVLVLLAPLSPAVLALATFAFLLIAIASRHLRTGVSAPRVDARVWRMCTKVLGTGAAILLVAVGIKAVQEDRLGTMALDLASEFPIRPSAAAPVRQGLPDIYLILLDGYPRNDKQVTMFGFDASGFTDALWDRGFVVAEQSRSNHTATRATLTQMFDYEVDVGSMESDDLWRHRINGGRLFDDIHGLGYEVIAVSPGFEHVALRRADRFLDTGQPNEFEWALLQVTSLRSLIEAAAPQLAADFYRWRMLDAFRVTAQVAAEESDHPRFVFTHVAGPHSPLVFERDGSPTDVRGMKLLYNDGAERLLLGWDEFARRLENQVAFVGDRALALADEIVTRDPGAVVVVFSDHGSGATNDPLESEIKDPDVRTANLLAVRAPGKDGIVENRSTLANVLPRLLRAYAGVGPADVAETIYISAEDPEHAWVFIRPD